MRMLQIVKRILCGCILLLLVAAPAGAMTQANVSASGGTTLYLPVMFKEPALPAVTLVDRIDGFDRPLHIANAGDGSNRLFVVEQRGRIWIVQNGQRVSPVFLDIRFRVLCCNERGLLSVAFPPDYAAKGYFYVAYINHDGNTVVARYHVGDDPNVADSDSEEIILTVEQPHPNHNGGQLAFGPQDGYLYIGMGDGGDAGDPENRAQNPLALYGKILRIDVESGATPYAVPPSNPFVGNSAYLPEIWAMGLRNPWRFSFDRLTADLYIGDVGQDLYEEVDYQAAGWPGGANYGWHIMEGDHCYGAATCDSSGLTLPIVTYDHSQGCSVIGGVVYRGSLQAGLQGTYLYGDFCTGRIWGLRRNSAGWSHALLHQETMQISGFGEDEQGEAYLADLANGRIYRIAVSAP
jgi:glucose/arabinose dehydrogenase